MARLWLRPGVVVVSLFFLARRGGMRVAWPLALWECPSARGPDGLATSLRSSSLGSVVAGDLALELHCTCPALAWPSRSLLGMLWYSSSSG
jgi:hypothetical protein